MTTFFKLFAFADNDLLAELTPIVYVLFIVGIIFCCIEVLSPGFEFFGITGVILLVASFIVYMVNGGNIIVLLIMLGIAVVVVGACIITVVSLIKKGKLKGGIFNVESSVPTGRTEGTNDFSYLLGQIGIAENFLRPVGDARFDDGSIVNVVARQGFIDSGSRVKVISVEGQVVKVEQVEN